MRPPRPFRALAPLGACLALGTSGALGTAAAADDPHALARRVVARFADGPAAAFDSVYPFAAGRALVADAATHARARVGGLARVVWRDSARAVIALSGYVASGNAGAETLGTRAFADLYEARRDSAGAWTLAARLPLDSLERICAHRIDVTVAPGEGLRVRDALRVVAGRYGFAARLNHRAAIARVAVDGRAARFAFAAGLLWVDAPAAGDHVVALEYTLPVPDDPRSWLAYMLPNSGLVRDQFVWHPILNYRSEADHATFDVVARVPRDIALTTSVAQRERVDGDTRVVVGRASSPTPAISLLWDREWRPNVLRVGAMRFETFVAPGFAPARDTLVTAFRRAFDVLRTHFGDPAADYFAVAQRREAPSGGWHFLSNATIVAGRDGGPPTSDAPFPRAFLGHELAHAWTHPTGAGALFLMEGWATFAESLVLADQYGAATERAFWEAERNAYLLGGYDGRVSPLADDANGGVSYAKGAWALRMLRDAVGTKAFDRGVRAYVHAPPHERADVAAFAAAMSRAAGRDVWPTLRPWLADSTLPAVRADVESGRVVLRVDGPALDQPLAIDLVTDGGRVRRTATLRGREAAVAAADVGPVRDVIVDPEHALLLRRTRGEVARFTLATPDAPAARSVALAGDFASAPVPAARRDGAWVVELPLSEGLYHCRWIVDGDARRPDVVREVRPLAPLDGAYPRP